MLKMNLVTNISSCLCKKHALLSQPWYTSVRFAKRIKRPSRVDTEFTDMALWRKSRGLETNPNKFGPLTNLPDYSYLDGRPVPLSMNLKRRIDKQREYAEQIVRLSGEVDFIRDYNRKKHQENEETKRSIINSKLKPKGAALLKKLEHNASKNPPGHRR